MTSLPIARLRGQRFARYLCATVAALLLGVSTAPVVSPGASFAVARSVTLSQSTELRHQVVTVSWTDFTPTSRVGRYQVGVMQCKADPASVDTTVGDCYSAQPYPDSAGGNQVQNGFTARNGTGSTRIEIRTDAQPLGGLTCNHDTPCSLVVYELDFTVPPVDQLPSSAVVVPLEFTATPADCASTGEFDLAAEGEWSSAVQMYTWAGQLCSGDDSLALDYTATSSNSGRNDQITPGSGIDLGVTSLPFTADELSAQPARLPFAYAPLDLNAVVVGFNVADANTQRPITDMTLSPRLIARLLTLTDLSTFFRDPEFRRLNPGHEWPTSGAMPPLVRADRNADTRLLTSWIAQDPSATAFLRGDDAHDVEVTPSYRDYAYPADNFENASSEESYQPLTNNDLVANLTFHATPSSPTAPPLRPFAAGYIAILDMPTATRYGLPLAKLVNHAGRAVAPTRESVLAGHGEMVNAYGFRIANFASDSTSAYALAKIDYAVTPLEGASWDAGEAKWVADAAKIDHLKRFLTYAVVDGQRDGTLLEGFIPLPAPEVERTRAIADSITSLGEYVPPTTTTTTTVPTTTTTFPTTTTTFPTTTPTTTYFDTTTTLGNSTTTVAPTTADGNGPDQPGPTTGGPKNNPTTTKTVFAPAWTPIAFLGRSGGGRGLYLLFVAGIAAVLIRVLMPLVCRSGFRIRLRLPRVQLPRVPRPFARRAKTSAS